MAASTADPRAPTPAFEGVGDPYARAPSAFSRRRISARAPPYGFAAASIQVPRGIHARHRRQAGIEMAREDDECANDAEGRRGALVEFGYISSSNVISAAAIAIGIVVTM